MISLVVMLLPVGVVEGLEAVVYVWRDMVSLLIGRVISGRGNEGN
jgi:hypothetical protein